MNKVSALLKFILTLSLLSTVAHAGNGKFIEQDFNSIMGLRHYKLYIPKTSNPKNKLPLIVMLHGCAQTANDVVTSSHIYEWADKEGFAVLLPDQSILYNGFKCWNWIIPLNNSRSGEAQVVIDMIDDVSEKHPINGQKVFAAGMSAGASMAGILGNCYPERVKAIASHDGVQYFASMVLVDFATVVLNGATVPAEQAGALGYACSVMFGPPKMMPIVIFQGMASPLMNPMHAFQIEDEFKIFNDYIDNGWRDFSAIKEKQITTVPDTDRYGYTKYTMINSKNVPYIERYMINKLGHAWSGGDGRFQYNDPKGPDATAIMIKFFKRFGL